MPRRSLVVALIFVGGGCFYDRARGGSASASGETTGDPTTTGNTTDDATAPTSSTTTSVPGTTTDLSTTSGEPATTGTTGAPGSSGEALDTTSTTTGTDTTDTTGAPPNICGLRKDADDCLECCADMHAAAPAYHAVLAECACDNNNECLFKCLGSLCQEATPSGDCVTCLQKLADDCTKMAVTQCLLDPECAAYGTCTTEASCTSKP